MLLVECLDKMRLINVKKYGIFPNETLIQTKKVQALIDSVDSGIIYFPKGKYVLSTIFLKDNIEIRLAKGAYILGALSFYDYAPEEKIDYPLYQDSSHSYFDCSLFVAKNKKNISFTGSGTIDMRSVWDVDNVRDIVNRGPKCIALKECRNILIDGIKILNATDLAIYFAGCDNVKISNIKMKVYIDGISPDNSKNVLIENCKVVSGDDGIVFKSSYTLNRLDYCQNIEVRNCDIISRCNAIKFGTETNGGFYHINIHDIKMKNTRLSGIAIESVDGAIIDDIKISNVEMKNVNAPIFIHLGKRLRGPEGTKIGQIKNITIENIVAKGPYVPYKTVALNYDSFIKNYLIQYPWVLYDANNHTKKPREAWQFSMNVCGLIDHPLENICFRNIDLTLDGGKAIYNNEVPEECHPYPEVYVYGNILPSKGIFFRHIRNLITENITVKTYRKDDREDFIFVDCK